MKKTKHLNCTWLRYRQLAKFSVVVKYGGAQSYWAREPQTVIWCPENQHRCFFQSNHGHHSIFYAMWFCFSGSWCCTKKKYCQYHKVVTYLNNWHNFQLHNAWTVKIIGEGSGPGVHYQGPLPSPILTVQVLSIPLWFVCIYIIKADVCVFVECPAN